MSPILMLLLSLGFSIGLCVHVVRTHKEMYWLWIILAFQPLGGLVYLIAILGPELVRGPTVRKIQSQAREKLDPTREYREAKQACDDAPTVRNQSRLAAAAVSLGRHDEAAALYAQAAQGIHADDGVLLLGWANALIELGRAPEALPLLDRLGQDESRGRTPSAALALGRAYEAVGRAAEAETAYQWAADRLPGLEGLGRYAAFLARAGRKDEARAMVEDMDRRIAKTHPQFQKEGRAWRDLAAGALNS
ncbi:tetratricopeptide repeat protein [Phenylobacterium aquaticum]|uniref:tetratricopeptide repeat protein n=1 Tax=Phenylobacterium aquaticum TaxID=1763816 RepID=UPI0026EADBD1|nr:tetratricopeptide repeat protein [Phenylobacterium aquaticum]